MARMRTLYNNDGTYVLGNKLHGGRPLTAADVCAYMDAMRGSPVTTYLICTNALQPYYPSAIERPVGIADGSRHEPRGERQHLEGVLRYGDAIRRLQAEGTDMVSTIIARGRELGLEMMTSQRMNDLHFTETGVVDPAAQSEFWLDHPEYRLGARARGGWHSDGALDWAIDAVRDHALALTEEIIERFESDGHELDFMRFPLYFGRGEGESNLLQMNDFVRRAAEVAGRVAARRGRPRVLSVRIPCGLARCRTIGLDPLAWVRAGWVDFITVSPFFDDKPLLPIRRFRAELGDPDLPIYGGVDNGVASYPGRRTKTAGLHRSIAANRFAEGADGLYLFNYFFSADGPAVVGDARVGHDLAQLADLADPARLRGRNSVVTEGGSGSAYGADPAFVLPVDLVEGAADFHLYVADVSVLPQAATLYIRVDAGPTHWIAKVNGHAASPVPADPGRYDLDANARAEDDVLAFAVPPAALCQGLNHVFLLRDPAEGTVLAADLVLTYGPPETHGWY